MNHAFVSIGDLRQGRVVLSAPVAQQDRGLVPAADKPADMPATIWEKVRNHPCYTEAAHHHYARMHVAVAPACNIQCHYCNRKYDCSNESRPGVVSRKLTPDEAARKVQEVAAAVPQLTVVGIAGPGDALANPKKTFETIARLRQCVPDIQLCLSTNGLALPQWVDEICRQRIDHVTITINMVDPAVGEKIYPWVFWNHRRVRGREAAEILHEQQMRGLELLSARGVLTKINSVLIPGVNDAHLADVNREVKARGAFLHNIMPLISAPEHGTHYGLTGQRGPTAQELNAVQDACAGGATLMRHCRQCRADAIGLLGEDRSEEFALAQIGTPPVVYDRAKRRAAQQRVEAEREAQRRAKQAALAAATAAADARPLASVRVAVASRGEGRVNQHFGQASEWQIYEVSATGIVFVGHRRVDGYCQGGWAEDDLLPSIIDAINDCHAVLVAKIGRCPRAALQRAGIEPVDAYAFDFIEHAALQWFTDYCDRVGRGQTVHAARGDARLRCGAFTGAVACTPPRHALPGEATWP